MQPTIHFHSRLFDVSGEPENPINPIRGMSVLAWLRTRVPTGVAMSAPEAEDWGWYCDLDWHGRHYLVGANANESDDGNHEWVVQIVKSRSFKERLLGQAKMSTDDPCLVCLHGLMARETQFTGVTIERGP